MARQQELQRLNRLTKKRTKSQRQFVMNAAEAIMLLPLSFMVELLLLLSSD